MHKNKVIIFCTIIIFSLLNFSPITFGESETAVDYKVSLESIGVDLPEEAQLDMDSSITRQEVMSLLNSIYKNQYKLESFQLPAAPTFSDVSANHRFYKDIEMANYLNITNGIGNGKFGIDGKVNENQAVIFAMRSLGYTTKNISYENAAEDIKYFYGIDLLSGEHEKGTPLSKNEFYELMYNMLAKVAGYNSSEAAVLLSTKNLCDFPSEDFQNDIELLNAYQNIEIDKKNMNSFFETYTAAPYEIISQKQLIEELGATSVSCWGYKLTHNQEYGYCGTETDFSFYFEDESSSSFSTVVSTVNGDGCTYGKILSIRKYPAVNGEIAYVAVIDENFPEYDPVKEEVNYMIRRGYIGFLVSPESKFISEVIVDTSYLIAHGLL